jgi:hypothetical protein
MKIIAYETCRVTMLFPLEEIIPLGGASDPEVIAKVQARYHFVRGPDLKSEEIAKNGYKFEGGHFKHGEMTVRIVDFALYRDGVVINGVETEGVEAFLDDVVAFMQKEFGFRDFITKPRRYFQSQVIVEFAQSPSKLIRSFDRITAAISEPLKRIYDLEVPIGFARLDFETDRTTTHAPAAIQRFIIERRAGISFDNERYFCASPMRTRDHVAVLEQIEGLIE